MSADAARTGPCATSIFATLRRTHCFTVPAPPRGLGMRLAFGSTLGRPGGWLPRAGTGALIGVSGADVLVEVEMGISDCELKASGGERSRWLSPAVSPAGVVV